MTKTLTEQWREGTLKGHYYVHIKPDEHCEYDDIDLIDELTGNFELHCDDYIKEVLSPVPSYDKVKEMSQKIERLEFDNEALEMAHNEGKEINAELVSKNDQLAQKMHILNEQNTKQYNELCEEIKKNNILEKQLEFAKKALKKYESAAGWGREAFLALKEMEGVK